jgi:hypothetical protein
MPIVFDEEQAVVSCRGDILVVSFGPDENGVGWLLLQEREDGEPGRRAFLTEPFCLAEQPGVLIAAKDVRSLNAIIDVLVDLRARVAQGEPSGDRNNVSA